MDAAEAKLLDLVQRGIPLAPRPFAELGGVVGLREEQVIARLRALKEQRGIIRQVSAIFDSRSLGYASSLVAAKYAPERLEAGAAVISGHPGVSHNYERQHAYNLWYTVAVGPDSKLGLGATVARLHELSGALATRLLPMVKQYKIGVRLAMGQEDEEAGGEEEAAEAPPVGAGGDAPGSPIGEEDIGLIRVLQQDLPLVAEPWRDWARQGGMTVEQLLEAARRLIAGKRMRRFAAVLRHRQAGFSANVMAVWRVAAEQADAVGQRMAGYAAVSHCYLRPTYEDWPYNLYTMVHARDREEARSLLDRMGRETGVDGVALWSLREFKKSRVRYFTAETAAWEAAQAGI